MEVAKNKTLTNSKKNPDTKGEVGHIHIPHIRLAIDSCGGGSSEG